MPIATILMGPICQSKPINEHAVYAVHWSGKRESQSQRENVENAKISGYIAPVKKRIKEKLNQNI